MKAAVVSSFDAPPRCQDFPVPVPAGADEMLVEVLAAGLHPRVRSQADGSHYTSTGDLPLVPGIDGVGRGADGLLRYFVLPDTRMGSMAGRTIIDPRRSIVLPEGSDPIAVAAAMNPAMSAWVALRRRVVFQPGQSVLVLGATGNAGRMAVQVARSFGAKRIVAAGRDADRLAVLAPLGATDTVVLAGSRRRRSSAWTPPTSTSSSITSGARPPPPPWPLWSPPEPTAASRWPGSPSARSPAPPRPSPRRPFAPRACRSSAAGKAR